MSDYSCEVYIVDEIMGRGKSCAAINYMNSHPDEHFLYITPYLDEIDNRIVPSCPEKNFVTPDSKKGGSKSRHIKMLLSKGRNIASTHALFKLFDAETIDICRTQNYTLIMDEVSEVIQRYEIGEDDLSTLIEKYVELDPVSNLFSWRQDRLNYKGRKFVEEKRLCELGCLGKYGNDILMWLFPIEAFNAFNKVYILTYMFHAQIQRYYYDYYGLPYRYIHVSGNSPETYMFSEVPDENLPCYNYRNMIHICEDRKLNEIGDLRGSLSKSWYLRNTSSPDSVVIKCLKDDLYNWFHNKMKSPVANNLWTTFKEFEKKVKGKGYATAHMSCNARATNQYRDRTVLAYPINKYLHVLVKGFFVQNNIEVDEDGYALSEMLQWIWRSAIRDGHEIWIYVPSFRMRNLLKAWINQVSSGCE